MTIVAAITDGRRAYMAADSRESSAFLNMKRDDCEKMFRHGDYIWAGSGECITDNFMVENRDELFPARGFDPLAFRDAMVEIWDDGIGCVNSVTDGAPTYPNEFLIARKGRLWYLDDSAFIREIKPYIAVAIGCGSRLAMGAFHVALDLYVTPDIPKVMCEAAIAHDFNCGGPIATDET